MNWGRGGGVALVSEQGAGDGLGEVPAASVGYEGRGAGFCLRRNDGEGAGSCLRRNDGGGAGSCLCRNDGEGAGSCLRRNDGEGAGMAEFEREGGEGEGGVNGASCCAR